MAFRQREKLPDTQKSKFHMLLVGIAVLLILSASIANAHEEPPHFCSGNMKLPEGTHPKSWVTPTGYFLRCTSPAHEERWHINTDGTFSLYRSDFFKKPEDFQDILHYIEHCGGTRPPKMSGKWIKHKKQFCYSKDIWRWIYHCRPFDGKKSIGTGGIYYTNTGEQVKRVRHKETCSLIPEE